MCLQRVRNPVLRREVGVVGPLRALAVKGVCLMQNVAREASPCGFYGNIVCSRGSKNCRGVFVGSLFIGCGYVEIAPPEKVKRPSAAVLVYQRLRWDGVTEGHKPCLGEKDRGPRCRGIRVRMRDDVPAMRGHLKPAIAVKDLTL